MHGNIYLDLIHMEHAERIRQAQRDRAFVDAVKARKRPSVLRSLLLLVAHS
jgi:hypothetical protein